SRVSQLLSTYVRERSKENPPIEFDESEEKPFLQEWGHHSFTPSTDVEQAVRALGQLVKITGVRKEDVSIDLRGANLQGFDLSDFQQLKPDYTNANFQGAHMQCANLSSATLDGAFLREAKLQGACLDNTFLRPTSHPANLIYARLQKAYFRNSNMPDVLIKGARLGNAIFEGATLSGARIEWSDLKGTNFQSAIMRGVILDGQVLDLTGLKMDDFTTFRGADLTGAAIRRVSFPTPWENPRYFPFSQDQVTAMYYDASVKWPEFVSVSSDRPDQALTEDAFHTAWRAFQASIGFDPDDPATW
ncbi:MAG: pentapeptide repeat-containing protein, partial [Pseudodonghicola sp.]